ncbi:hypothetical protein KVT40_007175 [Elsinoe batatas]|uniref:Uncharacterized protein n=1 Tax=Elsinoe batatas TaxID=2601811 RepID=A0A8K0PHB7_9PEZI|nr:hypothetical protein KVT40_007175 [Elsinoe batatas]
MFRNAVLAASLLSISSASLLERQIDISQQGCNGIIGDYYGTLYCCPGVAYNDTDEYPSGSGFCCVGAVFPIPGAGRFSDCFPNCGKTSSLSEVNILPITESQSCRTTIMFTDSEYTSKANAYGAAITTPLTINTESAVLTRPVQPTTAEDPTSSVTQSGGSSTPSSTSAGSSGASSSASSAASSATTGFSGPAITGSTSNSAAGASTSTSPSSALGARITSGPMAGALMVAGGILAAAL